MLQFIKFAVVGASNTVVDFLVFQLLNLTLGWAYLAQVIGYSAGVLNSYFWNSRWTFKREHDRSAREKAAFLAVNLASLGVSLGVLWLCKNPLGITDVWVSSWLPKALSGFVNGDTVGKLIATPCAILVNFIGNKLFVFRTKREEENSGK
ncbi:MAG: GtrA family protein [Clostridiales bacterium]|nr:GtrA family protein [Clostridiales bacterium]